jgi:predicted transcriptional regulator
VENTEENEMPISDLCSKKLISVSPKASVIEAAKLMKNKGVGSLLVMDEGSKRCKGFITDRDITLYAVAEGDFTGVKVSDVMSRQVATIPSKAGLADVLAKMEKHQLRRIVLVDDEGDACGILTSDDVIQLLAKEMGMLGNLFSKQVGRSEQAKA